MTCIVAIAKDNEVWMGADSAGSDGYGISTRADQKIFQVGEMLIGFTTSYRMGQLLGYRLQLPKHHEGVSVEEYLHTLFIDAVRDTLRTGGYIQKQNDVESGGTFIVGYRGRVFSIHSDFQVAEALCGYCAVGSGGHVAQGAMFATSKMDLDEEERINIALEAAEEFAMGVRRPFLVKKLEK